MNPERGGFGKPLDGVRILAPEQMQALPYATQLMAHLGAYVVKVEHPTTGESGRGAKPSLVDYDGREVGATYLRNNLGKKSITIDLKLEEGRELFKRLVPHFDIVAENFKPGTMRRLGLGYDTLSAISSRLIYVSVSGFGNLTETPYASWPAYAPIAEAMAGFLEEHREPGRPPRVGVAGTLGDTGSALFAVIGTLAALRQRDLTGVGQHVDVAMFDAMVAMADIIPSMYSLGVRRTPGRPIGAGIVNGFAAKDGYFIVQVIREHQFSRLAEVIGHPEWLDDPRLKTRQGWADHLESVIRPAIEGWASTKTKLEASAALAEAGIAAGPSYTPEDIIADPHVQSHNMLIAVPKPKAEGDFLCIGNPVKLSRMSEGPVTRWPTLGEHTDGVLKEVLGLGDGELQGLRQRQVI
jgi:formyl-CoA transferase